MTGQPNCQQAPHDEDGYIRLRYEALRQVQFVHLLSGLDEEPGDAAAVGGAVQSDIQGYTEWVSTCSPAISIGWDWRTDTLARPVSAVCQEGPRSNVMLVDDNGTDIGPGGTESHLGVLVNTLDWKPVVLAAVGLR